ncbi:MAG: S-layer homology domain-containing protein [Clostridia bacterium]|nr:S-layer homology domain-containing protein [Clostridia bacterium]
MKKVYISLLCCLMMITTTVIAEAKFNDISDHWAENVIEKWQDSGYINGYPDGSFKPNNPVTRAELSKILSSAFDLQETTTLTYEDITNGDWYYPYLEKTATYIPMYALPTLYESNIPYSENQGKNKFLPTDKAIRMHVAEALVKIKLDTEKIDIEELSIQEINEQVKTVFNDDEYSNLIAIPGSGIPQNVQRMNKYTWLAYKLDIMIGSDGYFNPYGYMTRAELITAIDRIITQ